jgi:BA14K-like protein
MRKLTLLVTAAAALASAALTPVLAQDVRPRPSSPANLPSAPPSPILWFFDGRDDVRDFPNNGFYPGDFAANPFWAGIGAAGLFGFNPQHATDNPPPQVAAGSPHQAWCARRYHSYDPGSGTFVGKNGTRYRCG